MVESYPLVPVVLGLVTIIGTVIAGLFKLLNDNTKALGKLVDSNKKIAKETAKGNREAKQRNGHLGDQSVQLAKLVTAQNKDVAGVKANTKKTAEILSKSALIAAEDKEALSTQLIHEQQVETQIVEKRK